jgi:hypothetical protein
MPAGAVAKGTFTFAVIASLPISFKKERKKEKSRCKEEEKKKKKKQKQAWHLQRYLTH